MGNIYLYDIKIIKPPFVINNIDTFNEIKQKKINILKYNNISYDTLTKKERNDIFNSHNMIEESIKQIHFNSKYPEQNNIYITTNCSDNIIVSNIKITNCKSTVSNASAHC